MRLTTKGRFAVTAMIDLALRENTGPVAASTTPRASLAPTVRNASSSSVITSIAKALRFSGRAMLPRSASSAPRRCPGA